MKKCLILLFTILCLIFSLGCNNKNTIKNNYVIDKVVAYRNDFEITMTTKQLRNYPFLIEYKIVESMEYDKLQMQSIVFILKNNKNPSDEMTEISIKVIDDQHFSFKIPINRIPEVPVKIFWEENLIAEWTRSAENLALTNQEN